MLFFFSFLAFFCAVLRAFSFICLVVAVEGGSMVGAAHHGQSLARRLGTCRTSDIPDAVVVPVFVPVPVAVVAVVAVVPAAVAVAVVAAVL